MPRPISPAETEAVPSISTANGNGNGTEQESIVVRLSLQLTNRAEPSAYLNHYLMIIEINAGSARLGIYICKRTEEMETPSGTLFCNGRVDGAMLGY